MRWLIPTCHKTENTAMRRTWKTNEHFHILLLFFVWCCCGLLLEAIATSRWKRDFIKTSVSSAQTGPEQKFNQRLKLFDTFLWKHLFRYQSFPLTQIALSCFIIVDNRVHGEFSVGKRGLVLTQQHMTHPEPKNKKIHFSSQELKKKEKKKKRETEEPPVLRK